jgi:hypothetical protein
MAVPSIHEGVVTSSAELLSQIQSLVSLRFLQQVTCQHPLFVA